MSTQNENSMTQKKNTQSKTDEIIKEVLKGETLKNAQNFIAYLRENKMSLQKGYSNAWLVKYKGNNICHIRLHGVPGNYRLDENSWHINPCGRENNYEDYAADENVKNLLWTNVIYCNNCGGPCNPGSDVTVAGKTFEKVCYKQILITNPDEETLEYVKTMINLRKNAVSERLGINQISSD